MYIKIKLLKKYISDIINNNIDDFNIDATKVADTTAIQILSEIQVVIKDESCSDFDAIEKIVCIFEKYYLDFGFRHVF